MVKREQNMDEKDIVFNATLFALEYLQHNTKHL